MMKLYRWIDCLISVSILMSFHAASADEPLSVPEKMFPEGKQLLTYMIPLKGDHQVGDCHINIDVQIGHYTDEHNATREYGQVLISIDGKERDHNYAVTMVENGFTEQAPIGEKHQKVRSLSVNTDRLVFKNSIITADDVGIPPMKVFYELEIIKDKDNKIQTLQSKARNLLTYPFPAKIKCVGE